MVTLKFITTSDLHGSIFQYDFIENEVTKSSLAQIYTYVQEQRLYDDQEVILLDNGDVLQGQPVVYHSNYLATDKQHICSQIFNFMKYDAGTVGNHDIETGHKVYDKLIDEFNFPWLAANAVHKETKEPYFEPYTILKRKGVKIAILGLITPSIPKWLPEKIWEGIDFEDMIVAAHKWVTKIKATENPDVIIGLFHSGVNYKYNNQTAETYKNENASLLIAQQVPGFDIIFAGHDHQTHNMLVVNIKGEEVLLLDPKSLANFVSVATIELEFNDKTQKFEKVDVTGMNLEMNFCETEESFDDEFGDYKEVVKDYVSKPIAVFTRAMNSRDALFGNTAFVDLIHRVQLDVTKAEISFASPLSFNTKVSRGEVFVRDMFKIYKFENMLYTMRLTGQEIKDYLEYSYASWFNKMRHSNDSLLTFRINAKGGHYLKGKYYNFSSASGINYVIHLDKELGERVEIINFINKNEFELDKEYTVAINSYRANGGGGHLIEGAKIKHEDLASRVVKKSDKDLRAIIMDWIQAKGVVTPRSLENWRATPNLWWKKGKNKSLRMLFRLDKS